MHRSFTLFVSVLVASAVSGQEPATTEPSPVFGAAATAVLVDVVVRDADGNLVTDLEAGHFDVLEDGVRQKVASFESARARRAGAGGGNPAGRPARAQAAADGASGPTGTPRLVALVFEQLGPEARAAAHKAARAYIDGQWSGDEFVGVFVVERSLHTLLPYTRDAGAVDRAVRTAVMRPGCPQYVTGDVAAAENGGSCRDGLPNRLLVNATLHGLQTLIDAMQLVPGRKSVLLFSEGFSLEVTSDVMDRFNAVVGRANRSGVSFYTVDAAGLRARNPSARARERMRTYTAEDRSSLVTDSVSPDELMFEQPHVALGRLASETGGAFIEHTNELERAAHRMGEDLRSYYLLGYAPANPALDGGFRRIEVKVRRPGVTVQARAGYLAVPVRRTLAPHDVAPLLTLESGTLPRDFRLDAEVEPGAGGMRIHARVPHAGLRYEEHAESVSCKARLTILARAVDRDGRTLWMNSDAFGLSSPLPQCEAARRLTTEFARDITLPVSATRIDVIAYDALAERASVRQFDLPGPKR